MQERSLTLSSGANPNLDDGIRRRLFCSIKQIDAASLNDLAVLAVVCGANNNGAVWGSASIREMDKLRLRPPLDGGVPHGIYVTGAPFPILQIDWPGWLCHSGIVRGLVGNIEFKFAVRSVAAKDDLIVHCLYDRACE